MIGFHAKLRTLEVFSLTLWQSHWSFLKSYLNSFQCTVIRYLKIEQDPWRLHKILQDPLRLRKTLKTPQDSARLHNIIQSRPDKLHQPKIETTQDFTCKTRQDSARFCKTPQDFARLRKTLHDSPRPLNIIQSIKNSFLEVSPRIS